MNFSDVTSVTDTFNSTLTEFDNMTNVSTTPGIPATPPPIGYYGDTKITLWKTISPIIIVVGGTGNILTLMVLLRQWKTFTSTSLYLITLAISDTMVLLTGPLRNWVKYSWDIDFRTMSESGCKVSLYITYSSIQFSSWLLVAVSVERAASVIFPHKVRLACTKVTAGSIIAAMFVAIYGLNISLLVINGLDSGSPPKCEAHDEYTDFFDNEYQILDFLVVFAIPFVVLLICNIIIIVFLERSRRSRKQMMGSHGGHSSNKDHTSVYVLMVGLCVIFFLSMTPAGIFHLYTPVRQEEIDELFKIDPYKAWDEWQYLLYQHAIVNIVSYTNAALNFVLYVFSGTKFRNELISMFACQKVKVRGMFGYTAKTGFGDSSSKTKSTTFSSNTSKSKNVNEVRDMGNGDESVSAITS